MITDLEDCYPASLASTGPFGYGDKEAIDKLIESLQQRTSLSAMRLLAQFCPAVQSSILGADLKSISQQLRTEVIGEINRVCEGPLLFSLADLEGVDLRDDTIHVFIRCSHSKAVTLNRLIIRDVFCLKCFSFVAFMGFRLEAIKKCCGNGLRLSVCYYLSLAGMVVLLLIFRDWGWKPMWRTSRDLQAGSMVRNASDLNHIPEVRPLERIWNPSSGSLVGWYSKTNIMGGEVVSLDSFSEVRLPSRVLVPEFPAAAWTVTALELDSNSVYQFRTSGKWIIGGHSVSADGQGWTSDRIYADSQFGALLGKIGGGTSDTNGIIFPIGRHCVFHPSTNGTLYVGPNYILTPGGMINGVLTLEVTELPSIRK